MADAPYIDLLQRVLETGEIRPDRTGTGTRSLFGEQVSFDLSDGRIPLLTTKRVYWKKVVEELLFFLRGSTRSDDLEKRGVNIWKGNSSREYLDSVGLQAYEVGELGPIYGFQWRRFGAQYQTHGPKNLEDTGIDQIRTIERQLREDKYSRRIVLSAWNPVDLPRMALPPCHVMAQFYVSAVDDSLSCHLYQRSVDMFLGFPWNMASYAVLTHALAARAGLKGGARRLTVSCGDVHVYADHADAAREQIRRFSAPSFSPLNPRLVMSERRVRAADDLADLTIADFEVRGYDDPMPHIPARMSV